MFLAENSTYIIIITTLAVLIALVLFLRNSGRNKQNEATDQDAEVAERVTEAADTADAADAQLVAVLSAAIAAMYEDNTKFRVKSFRRMPQPSSLWNTAARNEQVIGRF